MIYTEKEKQEAIQEQNQIINKSNLIVVDKEKERGKTMFWFMVLFVIGLCCVGFCILVYGVHAVVITTTPVAVDVIAGDSFTMNYTLIYEGDSRTTCYISTTITPDDEGIRLTYAPETVLQPHSTLSYQIYVETDLALLPAIYTITTVFQTDATTQPTTSSHHFHTGTIMYNSSVPEIPTENEPPVDIIIPPVIIPPLEEPTDTGIPLFVYFLFLLFIIFVSVLLFYVVRKHKKEK